jgi:hypothetical protein
MCDFETIDIDLDSIYGGVDANVTVNGQVTLDANQLVRDSNESTRDTIHDVGSAARISVGCAAGAFGQGGGGMREFGNCILTGQLGGVPQVPQPPTGT